MMRVKAAVMTVVLLLAANAVLADEPLKPEQLKKAYDDALVQLKAAQDRKAELAKENEALAAKVEDLKKQLAASQVQIDSMKREIADNDDRSYMLRSYQAAWQRFIRLYPEVMTRWNIFLGDSVLSGPRDTPDFFDPDWIKPLAG
jgi:septal ring factor EnvC (AmiA/AmiB activator)